LTATAVEAPRYWTRNRITGVVLVAAGLAAAAAFGALATDRDARFTLIEDAAGAALSVNGTVGAAVVGLIAACPGAAPFATAPTRSDAPKLGVGVGAVAASSLSWQVCAAARYLYYTPLVHAARGTFNAAPPLIGGAHGGVLCERSGVINVA